MPGMTISGGCTAPDLKSYSATKSGRLVAQPARAAARNSQALPVFPFKYIREHHLLQRRLLLRLLLAALGGGRRREQVEALVEDVVVELGPQRVRQLRRGAHRGGDRLRLV